MTTQAEVRRLFWWRWLVMSTVGVLVFGLAMVLLPGPTQRLFNYIYLASPHGDPVFGPGAAKYIAFVSGVLGAVMFAWSVTLLFVLFGPFRRGRSEGWRAMAVSVGAWFVTDTGFSLWTGYWQNAVLNLILLGLFALPLAATYRSFTDT